MSRLSCAAALLAVVAYATRPAMAADTSELQQLQQQIDAMRQDYEARLKALEARLRRAEAAALAAPPNDTAAAAEAQGSHATSAPAQRAPDPPAAPAANAFNPAIALVLSGSYAWLSRDPDTYRFAGFLTGGEIGPGVQGFSLGESELTLSASVDPWFFGSMSVALAADNSASVEEAFVQTTALPAGFGLKGGRFLSGIGYLNGRHAHTWDFVDQPLAYQAFLDGQLKQDGLQLRVLLPTVQFVELGAEIGAAGPFPSAGSNGNRPGTAALFAHSGGDVGASHSWRAGLSYLWAHADGRESWDFDADGERVVNRFDGTGRMVVLDGVWKWAPDGNPQRRNLTLQGEYLRRAESGDLSYDIENTAASGRFSSTQSGWYAQAVYQFMPAWRVGLRYDRLNVGDVDAGSNAGKLFLPDYSPSRATLMLDWSPSEFSRVRLQYANDRARYGLTDNQFIVQYQMSLGAHGAHGY